MKKWLNKQTITVFIITALVFGGVSVGASALYQFTLSTDSLYVDGIKVEKPLYKFNGTNYPSLRSTAEILGLDIGYTPGRIDLTSPKTGIEAVAKNVESCVLIRVYSTTDPATARLVGTASGVVIKDGIIITNKHVTGAGVMFGIQYQDTAAGIDYKTTEILPIDTNLDIGFIKSPMPAKAVKIGDSDKLLIGQDIVTISSPGGLKNNVTKGIVSGLSDQKNGQTIQVNADIGKGASGGAVFDMNGELIGIIAAGLAEDMKFNYTIPINSIKPLLDNLK